MSPVLDSVGAHTRKVIITRLFIRFKKEEKAHLKSGFGVNDYFSKP